MTIPRITFMATGKSGLGHLRRVASIAGAIRELSPGADLSLMTNAAPEGISAGDLDVFGAVRQCDRHEMARRVGNGRDMIVCDTARIPDIHLPGGRKVLILRETPDDRVARFRIPGGWDRVVVPNPPGHWLPCDRELSTDVEAAGWIVRPTGPRKPEERPAGVVVATGGGGTPETRAALYPLLDRMIAKLRRRSDKRFRLRQALGPRAGGDRLEQADEAFDPGGDLNGVFRAADLVITTAGYNSVLELATTDTPALLVPIARSIDDQRARVRHWGPLLGHGYDPATPDASVDWLADRIARPSRRAPVDLGADGTRRAAELILDLL